LKFMRDKTRKQFFMSGRYKVEKTKLKISFALGKNGLDSRSISD